MPWFALGFGLGAGALLIACDAAEDEPSTAGTATTASLTAHPVPLPRGVSADVPAGWQLLGQPITGVTYPVQVLAAASYPVTPGKPSPGCRPGRLLDQKPPGGALLQVIEWTHGDGQPNLGDFPPRETPFALPADAYATYECAGPGYNVAFRDRRRRFQAFLMLDRERVNPRIRRQAIELLTSMRFANARADRRVRRKVVQGARRDFRVATGDPAGFAHCFLAKFAGKLDPAHLRRLIALRTVRGEASAARALNGLGVDAGDSCGGRQWVPQLLEAASGLASR